MSATCAVALFYVILQLRSVSAQGICRSKSPHSFSPGESTVGSNQSDIYVYTNYSIECSGRVTAVELFANLNSSAEWNDTLRLKLLFLEEDRDKKVYTVKAKIPVSAASSELKDKHVHSIHLTATQIPANVTIAPPFAAVGFELPQNSNINKTVYNHIPLLNTMNIRECSTVIIEARSEYGRLFCPFNSPPLILTVDQSPTGGETITEATCFSDGSAPAVLFMVFIIIILLLVVVALAIALVLVGRKFRQLRKKTLNISTQEESTRCNAVYSHIAEREAVYEELPYSSDRELAIGHAKVHDYHVIEGATKADGSSAPVTHRTNSCTTTDDESAYNVLHFDDEDNPKQYQDLPDEACAFSDGNYHILDPDPEPTSSSAHHYHAVDRRSEENQYHVLEDNSELTGESCVESQHHVVKSDSSKENVYHTLEVAGATAEDSSDTQCSTQQCMNANTICDYTLSVVHVLSASEQSTDSADDVSVHHTRESGANENPYHILEVEDSSECQALNEKREEDHVYEILDQGTDC